MIEHPHIMNNETWQQTLARIAPEEVVRVVIAGTATNTAAVGAPVGVRIDRARRLDGVAVGPNIVRLR